MNPDLVFLICNYGVLPAWLLLMFAPKWNGTEKLVFQVWIPILLGVVYVWAMWIATSGSAEGGSMATLPGVVKLFSNPYAVLGGWIHYLAFDLFIGAWQVRDARRREIPHSYVIPCLVLTLVLGPIGLMLYLGLRWLVWGIRDLEEGAKA